MTQNYYYYFFNSGFLSIKKKKKKLSQDHLDVVLIVNAGIFLYSSGASDSFHDRVSAKPACTPEERWVDRNIITLHQHEHGETKICPHFASAPTAEAEARQRIGKVGRG